MRGPLRFTFCLMLVALLALVAVAPAAGRPEAKATGDAVSEVTTAGDPDLRGIRTLVFNGQGTLTAAKGYVYSSISWPPTGFFRSFEGEVGGYWQEGNHAAVRGVITASTGYSSLPQGPPTHFVLRVVDNGQGSGAESDRFMAYFGWSLADDEFMTDWEAGPFPFSTWSVPVSSGNIVVH